MRREYSVEMEIAGLGPAKLQRESIGAKQGARGDVHQAGYGGADIKITMFLGEKRGPWTQMK